MKDKRQVKALIKKERAKIYLERERIQEKIDYWKNQLSDAMNMDREFTDVYDELYDYSRVTIENSLRPLKEFYYNNP